MLMSSHLPQSLKTPADNADNTAISRAACCDVVRVGGRGVFLIHRVGGFQNL